MQDTRPLLTSSTWAPSTTTAFNISASLSSLNMSTLPTLEPFHQQLSFNTTTPRDIGSTPAPPTSESSDRRQIYIQKLLDQFSFKPLDKASDTSSLFPFHPFKPMDDWKPFNNLPEYKPKYYRPSPPAPAPQNGALNIAMLIAGLSGGLVILALICVCACSRRSDRPRGKPKPRGSNWPSGYYGSDTIEMGGDPPQYSYTNDDVTVETGADHSWASDGAGCDSYSCDADAGGGGGDCGPD